MLYRLLIVAATLIWGSSFVIVKDTTDVLSPAWILVVRFAMAAILLAVFLIKRKDLYFKKEYVGYGALLGLLLFCAYYFQTIGITDTTPGKNAFLTGTYCVMVPFLAWWIAKRKPNAFNIVAAIMCVAGIGFVSLDSGLTMRFGDAMTLGGAVFYALHICAVAKVSQGRDIFVLTMWQFAFVAVFSCIAGLVFEPAPDFASLQPEAWWSLVYLGVGCTALALLFQNVGQQKLAPSTASLLLSLESPIGVLFSVLLGAEVLNGRMMFGFALIFAAIIVSEVLPDLKACKRRKA